MNKIPAENSSFYSGLAQKFGSLTRNKLMKNDKISKQRSFTIHTIINSLRNLNQNNKVRQSRKIQKTQLYSSKKIMEQKIQLTQQFKLKLKLNLDQSRIKDENRILQLNKRVRWRRNNMKLEKTAKFFQYESRKKQQINLMKYILEKQKQDVSRAKRQTQLEQNFKRLERRLKTTSFSYQKRNE